MEYLTNDNYRQFITVPKAQGVDFTHLANLNTSTGLTQCYVKIYPDDEQSLLNEIIGYLYAKEAGIPVPKQAGLVEITIGYGQDINSDDIPVKHAWVKNQAEAIGWYTSDEQTPSLLSYFGLDQIESLQKQSGALYARRINQMMVKAAKAACEKKHLGAICAFDYVFANIDRNIGNILFGSSLIAIDHGRIFGSNHWAPKELPQIAKAKHKHVIREFVEQFLQDVPNNVGANAVATYDTISHLCGVKKSKDVLKFLSGFSNLDDSAIFNAVEHYLAARLKQESAYKKTFNRLI